MKLSCANSPGESTIDIWFAEISDSSLQYEQQLAQFLPSQELSRLTDKKHPRRRREFVLSRVLIRYALSARFDYKPDFWHFDEKPGQAPTIANLPLPVKFSLTHSGGLIACALSNHPVGIDLEQINHQRDIQSIAKIAMTEEELKYLKQDAEMDIRKFYQFWCGKEAIFKMLPTELQSKTSLRKISALHPEKNAQQAFTLERQLENYVISIASTKGIQQINAHCLTMSPQNKLVTALTENSFWRD